VPPKQLMIGFLRNAFIQRISESNNGLGQGITDRPPHLFGGTDGPPIQGKRLARKGVSSYY
jgi:hypothetical protein